MGKEEIFIEAWAKLDQGTLSNYWCWAASLPVLLINWMTCEASEREIKKKSTIEARNKTGMNERLSRKLEFKTGLVHLSSSAAFL